MSPPATGSRKLPPAGDTKMSVLGFQEAHEHADIVRVRESPAIDIRVATPVGLTLLKLIAWQDRTPDVRPKDALDLRYLLENYERIPEVSDTLYGDTELGGRYEWDTQLMAAEHLGKRVREIAATESAQIVHKMAGNPQILERIALEMSDWDEPATERSATLLTAFLTGFGP